MNIFNQQPAVKPGDKCVWGGLPSSGRALAVVEAALKYSGLTLIITDTAQQASTQSRALAFFAAQRNLSIFTFPDWETLPYDIFSPHQDIISARLQTLAKLAKRGPRCSDCTFDDINASYCAY